MGSTNAVRAGSTATAAMSPRAAALTPSGAADVHGERRSAGMRGATTATMRNDGWKMPSVASTAPGAPSTR